MLYYLLIAAGLITPFFLIKYREDVGNTIGEADWMKKIGGVYNFIIVLAFLIFFWTIAEITGTTGFLFSPFKSLFPAFREQPPVSPF